MVRLFLSGDVMTARGVDQIHGNPVDPQLHEIYVKDARGYVQLGEQAHGRIPKPANDRYVWGFALDVLDKARPAARIVNLETAVTTSERYWQGKEVHYRMSPKNLGCLKAARIDCCTLANNHVLDWEREGLRETLASLAGAGFAIAGAGRNDREARAPAILPLPGGHRLLVFAFAGPDCGVPPDWAADGDRAGIALLRAYSGETLRRIASAVKAARGTADLVIVSIHWGGNWGYELPDAHRRLAHGLIDAAGVDLVHGHSSHHVKGIEVHGGRLILYGCGDLITDYEGIAGKEQFRGDIGLLYFPEMDESGRLRALHMQPTRIRQMQLRRPPMDDVAWLRDTLNREGEQLGTRVAVREDGMLHLQWEE